MPDSPADTAKPQQVVRALYRIPKRMHRHRLNHRTIPSLTPGIEYALDALAYAGMKREQAAEAAGLSDAYLRKAMMVPAIRVAFMQRIEVLRSGHIPEAWSKVAQLMQSGENQRLQLDAAKVLIGQEKQALTVNVGIQNNVQPGYIVDVSGRTDRSNVILQQAGSVKSNK
jgi:hypothetical protein